MLLKLARFVVQKLAVALAIALVAVAGYGLWLYLQEEGLLEQERTARLQQAVTNRERLLAFQNELETKITAARAELERERLRARKAAEVVATLRQLESWWDRVFGNPQQQSANAEQMRRMEALKSEAGAKMGDLHGAVGRFLREKESLGDAVGRANVEVALLEAAESEPRRFLLAAWEQTKWGVALALAGYFLGPTLWSISMYYGVARFFSAGRPIQLAESAAPLPDVGASHVSIEVPLAKSEVLRVREKFLQSSDEGLRRGTRFVLDWRIPLTSVACGLVELIELQHAPEGGAAGALRVTLSNAEDPHIELAIVEVPLGASLVLRPSYLAGVLQADDDPLEIRRHWRLFHWPSWIAGQFRFFEFVGPCRLVVAGSRGVRAERLHADPSGQASPARRTNQGATIGFTPHLHYRAVRAETFWSYFRGMNPLFDDVFSGEGIFLVQETSLGEGGAKAAPFWASVWGGILKVFGL